MSPRSVTDIALLLLIMGLFTEYLVEIYLHSAILLYVVVLIKHTDSFTLRGFAAWTETFEGTWLQRVLPEQRVQWRHDQLLLQRPGRRYRPRRSEPWPPFLRCSVQINTHPTGADVFRRRWSFASTGRRISVLAQPRIEKSLFLPVTDRR
jgi:hypothetical protein